MFTLRQRFALLFTLQRTYFSAQSVSDSRCISAFSAHEKSKYMQKLLNKKGAKTKKKWYQPHIAEPLETFGIKQEPRKSGMTPSQRIRARQLAHVLYDKITQIMNTGELSEDILNKQVLITTVKMHPDFSGINVYWDSSRTDAAEIEPLLQANSGRLRSLLISYHVLGRIPPITFVRDRSVGDITRLNQLLEVADYGPDYIPTSQRKKAHTDDTLWGTPLETQSSNSATVKLNNSVIIELPFHSHTQIHDSTKSDTWGEEPDENKDPHVVSEVDAASEVDDLTRELKFRSNLYGLPHDDLMKKVLAYKRKVKYQGNEESFAAMGEKSDFRTKHLSSQKDKMKLKSPWESTKFKQRLLESDFLDFRTSENTDETDEQLIEEYDDVDDDEWNEK